MAYGAVLSIDQLMPTRASQKVSETIAAARRLLLLLLLHALLHDLVDSNYLLPLHVYVTSARRYGQHEHVASGQAMANLAHNMQHALGHLFGRVIQVIRAHQEYHYLGLYFKVERAVHYAPEHVLGLVATYCKVKAVQWLELFFPYLDYFFIY